MNFENGEFQFAVELIIANRNETGATLSDIRVDYYNAFGISFESMFGNFWTVELQNLLVNTMDTVFKKQLPGGYLLFFIKAAKLKEKIMEVSKREHMMAILEKLKVDPNNIKSLRSHNNTAQSSFNSFGQGSSSSSSASVRSPPTRLADFYNHVLIADNFFLEISNVDLQMPKSKNNQTERIGLCISGQTLKSANRTISYGSFKFFTPNVILNIGTFDLLNGHSAEIMIANIVRLLNTLKTKNLQPILTTLAPLPNHMDGQIEANRQAFNKFIRENFDFIDIEKCFLSNEKRVLLECYQLVPKPVGKHAVILWNRVGRQRVVQQMKREIPTIHSLF